jgi:hypothetical protein
MGFIWNLFSHANLVLTAGRGILKILKGLSHSNFGLIGLDRVMSFFGLG